MYGELIASFARDSGRYNDAPIRETPYRKPPPGRRGRFTVSQTVITCPTVFEAYAPGRYRITGLYEHGEQYPWMSDSPQERAVAEQDEYHNFPGGETLLILGLGLGIFPQIVEERYRRIIVIERDRDVIRAVWKYVAASHWEIELGDAWDVERIVPRGSIDHCYADIWPTLSTDNAGEYRRMKKLIRYRIGAKRTVCWGERFIYGRRKL